jgi:hypothetical protein
MINWRTTAMKKGPSQDELNNEFALKTEIFHPKSSGSNSQKSRRSCQQHDNDAPEEGDSKPPPHKRIRLASSRWVITERYCCRVHRMLAYLSRGC